MEVCRRLLRAVALAVALVCVTAAVSHAAKFEFPNAGRGIRLRWTSFQFIVGERTVDCELILSGSINSRTLVKTAGTTMATLSEATFINLCTGGTAIFLRSSLPWRLLYASYNGTLPRITAVNFQIIGMEVLITPTMGVSCLARTTTTNPGLLIANVEREQPTFENTRLNETASIPLTGMGCTGSVRFGGGGIITEFAEIASVIVRLI